MFQKAVAHSDDRYGTYTVEEIQAILGVSTSTVYGILRANLFPYRFTNGHCEIQKTDFDQWFGSLEKDIDV